MTHFSISSIDDVLPYIAGRSDFIVAHKGDYKVIDYVFASADTFDHPARIECRGLKFASDGSVLARPLHRFFNINERVDTQAGVLDFGQPHEIVEKLDGSMIHPAIVQGDIVLMTRMGRTDVARKAEALLTHRIRSACYEYLRQGATPVFEWTAPENRIVVRYNESRLTLLAVRENESGEYWSREGVERVARDMNVPIVARHDLAHASAHDFVEFARAIRGSEGFVVRFVSGLWVKAKGEDYVLKHKAKDSIMQEKNLLALVLSGGLDDVLPLLDKAGADIVREYAASVEAGISRQAETLGAIVAGNENLSQKDFALSVLPTLPAPLRSAAFMVRAGQAPTGVIRARIAANCNSSSQVEECRPLHGATFKQ